MPIIVVGSEKNFAALRPRLFAGKVSTKVAGEVRQAIRDANPHADLDRLQPGTVLTVPDAPKVAVRGDLSLDETTREAIRGVASAGKGALQALVEAGAAREAENRRTRKRTVARLDAAMDAGRDDERLAANLESARTALGEEDARAKERTSTLKKAQAEWTAELDALSGLLD